MSRLLQIAGLFVALLPVGCGHAHRPASVLTERDRVLLADYETVRAGLAANEPRAVHKGAAALVADLKKNADDPLSKRLLGPAAVIADGRSLDLARDAFRDLSATLIPLADGVDGYYILTSPPGPGMNWVQTTPEVDNPYLGRAMHDTGSVRK